MRLLLRLLHVLLLLRRLLHVLDLWLLLHMLHVLLLLREQRNHAHAVVRSEEALGGSLSRKFEHRVALAVPQQRYGQDILRAAGPQAPVVHVWGVVKSFIQYLVHSVKCQCEVIELSKRRYLTQVIRRSKIQSRWMYV